MTAVIVDDEPLARERVRTLAEAHGLRVVAECGDGDAALTALEAHRPDLVFLDIQLPELNGFEVLEAVPAGRRPAVVFITAYDEHALRAFEVHAVDYLVKPLDPARFATALARARERLGAARDVEDPRLTALLAERRASGGGPLRLVVREGERLRFVRADHVEWIESAANYVKLHAGGRAHLVRSTLKSLEERLDPALFVRIHRSLIVNLDRIASVEPYFHGEYVVVMTDGTRLTSSRTHSARLRSLLR